MSTISTVTDIEEQDDIFSLSRRYASFLEHSREFREELYEMQGPEDIPYRTMSWNMAYCAMTAETVALGVLSLPSVFSTLGYVPGVVLVLSFGILSTYTGFNLGQFRLNHPEVSLFYWTLSVFNIFGWSALPSWNLPRTLRGVSYMSVVSILSICCALIFTGVALIIQRPTDTLFQSPKAFVTNVSFSSCLVSIMDVIFAYAGHLAFFNFIAEMRDPKEFSRALFGLQVTDITIYLLTGTIMYAFGGGHLTSPIISTLRFSTLRQIAYGLATPMIVIAGVIYAHVAAKFLFFRLVPSHYSSHFRRHTYLSWIIWSTLCAFIWCLGWLISEAIPFFNELLSLTASLYASQFTYGLSGVFWLFDHRGERRPLWMLLNIFIVILGLVIMILGVYSSIVEIILKRETTHSLGLFSC
ncbi:N amino acid transport system protein [Galdieria sulphuraria]|nr:N amino acid transport system protein [Galdieria sulphuraria]